MNRPNFTIIISRRALKIAGVICVSIVLLLSSLPYAYGEINQTKLTATVAGWFATRQIDNENVSLATNMNVWVNGRQFVVCSDPAQTVNMSLVPSY